MNFQKISQHLKIALDTLAFFASLLLVCFDGLALQKIMDADVDIDAALLQILFTNIRGDERTCFSWRYASPAAAT